MTELNAEANAVKDGDYKPITVVDVDHIEINEINAAGFKAYLSGGYVQFNSPVDLAGYVARMQIKDKVGGAVLASSLVGDAPLNIVTLTVDNVAKTILLAISATATAAIAWKKGFYEIEMVSPTGVVTAILSGVVNVTKEVTT
jgi:hypothetical protein